MERYKKLLITFLATFISLIFSAPLASAHVDLNSTIPTDGSVYPIAPKESTLKFEGLVDPSQVIMTLRKSDGTKLANPERKTPNGPTSEVTFILPNLSDGGYVSGYRVYSSDGHIIEGEFSFAVGNAPPPTTKKYVQPQGGRTFEVFGRSIFDLGLILLIGSLYWLFILLPKKEDEKFKNPLFKIRRSEEISEITSFLYKFLLLGSVIMSLGALFRLMSYLVVVIPGSDNEFRWNLFTNKNVIALSLATFISFKIKNMFKIELGRKQMILFFSLLTSAVYCIALVSHAADQALPYIDAFLLVFHLFLISLWIGPILIYLFLKTINNNIPKEDMVEGLKQFSPLGIFAVICASATGFSQAYINSGGGLPKGEYFYILIFKITIIIIGVMLGGINNLLLRRNIQPKNNKIFIEILLLLTVVAIASILAITPPLRG